MMAIRVLLDHGVQADHIIFAAFVVASGGGIVAIQEAFPGVRVVTAAVDAVLKEAWVGDARTGRRVWHIEPGMGHIGKFTFPTQLVAHPDLCCFFKGIGITEPESVSASNIRHHFVTLVDASIVSVVWVAQVVPLGIKDVKIGSPQDESDGPDAFSRTASLHMPEPEGARDNSQAADLGPRTDLSFLPTTSSSLHLSPWL